MEDESADDSDTERRGDDAPLPVAFSSLFAATFISASVLDVNGSLGRDDSAAGPVCRRPIMGVCDRSYVNSIVRPIRIIQSVMSYKKPKIKPNRNIEF